jgi:hypothetical protein
LVSSRHTPLLNLQDAARDLADDGDGQGSEQEYSSSSTWLRRASASSRDGGGANSPADGTPEEVARFGVAKERKGLRSAGIAAFNRSAGFCLFTYVSQVCHIYLPAVPCPCLTDAGAKMHSLTPLPQILLRCLRVLQSEQGERRCRGAVKGVAALVASGVVVRDPAALAAFLREHEAELDRAQVTNPDETLNRRAGF